MLLNKRDLVALGAGDEPKKKKADMTHEELLARKNDKERAKKRVARKAENGDKVLKERKGDVKLTEAQKEAMETRKKNLEHKQVREAKMREWNGEKQSE